MLMQVNKKNLRKKEYRPPEMATYIFLQEDIVTVSGEPTTSGGGIELPDDVWTDF